MPHELEFKMLLNIFMVTENLENDLENKIKRKSCHVFTSSKRNKWTHLYCFPD